MTYDGQTVITGSQDSSLKVWEVSTGKITQILVGHEAPVTCIGTAALSPSLVISGSQDCNAIIWDMNTGSEILTLSGHQATVTQVVLNLDGSLAITAGEDNVILIWNESGARQSIIDVHHSIASLESSLNSDQIVLQLVNNVLIPIMNLANNPAKGKTIALPAGTPTVADGEPVKPFPAWRGILPGVCPTPKAKGFFAKNLKREQSFDSFYFDQLNRGVSVDDFRKLGALGMSPAGSREHLPTTGIIWDGSGGAERGASGHGLGMSRPGRMKLGPKSKMLKKQQSMFAFFPEHGPALGGSVSSLVRAHAPPPAPLAVSAIAAANTEKKRSLQEQRLRKSPPSRSQSLEEKDEVPVAPPGMVGGLASGSATVLSPGSSSVKLSEVTPEVVVEVSDSGVCVIC